MRKLIGFVLIAFLFMVGCGNGMYIESHTISREEMTRRYGPEALGHAIWDADRNECDMYLMPVGEYVDLKEYLETRGHEDWHCFVGYHHDENGGD